MLAAVGKPLGEGTGLMGRNTNVVGAATIQVGLADEETTLLVHAEVVVAAVTVVGAFIVANGKRCAGRRGSDAGSEKGDDCDESTKGGHCCGCRGNYWTHVRKVPSFYAVSDVITYHVA